MKISKIGEKILEALAGGGEVSPETLAAITPEYKKEIRALKKEGALIKGYQDETTRRIFYILEMAGEKGEGTPPDVRPPAPSPSPAAPSSGSSPAESPGTEAPDDDIIGSPRVLGVTLSEVTASHFPKTGRVKFTGWIEDPQEKKYLQRFLVDNEAAEYDIILGPRKVEDGAKTASPAKEGPEVEEKAPDAQAAGKTASPAGDEGGLGYTPGDISEQWRKDQAEAELEDSGIEIIEDPDLQSEDTSSPLAVGLDLTEVPIYNETGNIIGYRRVEPEKKEKTAEEIRKEIPDSGISTAAAAGMEELLDQGPAKAPDSSI